MKWIKRLEFRNVLGITELQLNPGKITLIQGENESGKTSILEAIEKAIYNKNRRAEFVRKGEKEATLYIEIDDGTLIDKKVLPDGEVRSTISKDGIKLNKPETLLKSLAGEYSFNPVDFLLKTDKEQTQLLLSLIPMRLTEEQLKEWTGEVPPVDLERHAIEVLEYLAEKYFYDKRTMANTELKDIKNQIDSLRTQLPDNYRPDEWEKVDLYSLHEKVREARDHNLKIAVAKKFIDEYSARQTEIIRKYDIEKKNRIQEDAEKIQQIKDEIARLQKELAGIEGRQEEALKDIEKDKNKELENFENEKAEKEEFLKNNKPIEDESLLAEAKKAEEMKGYLNIASNLKRLELEEVKAEKEAIRLDNIVNDLRKKPAELLKGVELPVKGLGINDKMQPTIDGLPISNLSTSRKISLAVDIARATSKELGAICIDRFETLDTEHKKMFLKEIENDSFQYFITEVTEGPLKITEIGA
ncbi:MAG: AAA family ATPase [Methanofastidiosum sp.]